MLIPFEWRCTVFSGMKIQNMFCGPNYAVGLSLILIVWHNTRQI